MPAERSPRALGLCALVLLLAGPAAAAAEPAPVVVETESFRAVFARATARLSSLEVRAQAPAGAPGPLLFDAERGAGGRLDSLHYTLEREERPREIVLRFRAPLDARHSVEQLYTLPRRGFLIRHDFSLLGPAPSEPQPALALHTALRADAFSQAVPETGFSGRSQRARLVAVDAAGGREVTSPDVLPLEPGRWVGVRNRAWALLWRSERGTVELTPPDGLRVTQPAGSTERLYLGPLDSAVLEAADPALGGLLFAGLWLPIRVLARVLMAVLDALLAATGGAVGPSILLLALSVRTACLPLARLAERWQREVDRERAAVEPDLAELRTHYRGEERSRRVFAVYRAHGVHPLHGLKSLLGVAIQIPLFFAAYHLLDEHVALAGARFLWIDDLARPDHLAALPFALPLAGDALNLLPLLMTLANLLASRLHDAGPLPARQLRTRRLGLYAMAAAFLALFYTFPAGMVLYWTANNTLSLLRACAQRLTPGRSLKTLEVPNAQTP